MPASSLTRIADPLIDRFALEDLPRIAPWVAESIGDAGVVAVREAMARNGEDPSAPQPMMVWVAALTACNGRLWEALDVA